MSKSIEQLYELVTDKKYDEAIIHLNEFIKADNGNSTAWHLLGQSYRFTGDIEQAIKCHEKAYYLNDKEPAILLALGIAHQINQNYDEAVKALRKAIRLDETYVIAFNSLALTYKRMGSLDKALDVYTAGLNAIAKKFCLSFENSRANKIHKHKDIEFTLWIKYIVHAAIYLSAKLGFDKVLIPNAIQTEHEENTEEHQGLYWVDKELNDGEKCFEILPNLLNTFRESLRGDRLYISMLRDQGLIFEMTGKEQDALASFAEADYFESELIF